MKSISFKRNENNLFWLFITFAKNILADAGVYDVAEYLLVNTLMIRSKRTFDIFLWYHL